MMEAINSLDTTDIQSQPTVPLSPPVYVPPILRGEECYHVFISYSSTDYQWTHSLINQLESCGLHVCYHERDFTPGRTVLENMSECIQESQKVLLVLSTEFVRSRWCLLEANMSLFRDCLERKPIIPVLLDPEVSVPLHLCHLTYLEASDHDFVKKLLKVICTPNQQLQGSTVLPFQPPSIYNGKALQPLIAVNDEGLKKWDCGQFSEMEVPDQLRLIIEDREQYRRAVRLINRVSQNKIGLPLIVTAALIYGLVAMSSSTFFLTTAILGLTDTKHDNKTVSGFAIFFSCCIFVVMITQVVFWEKDIEKNIVKEMQKAIGEANIILSEQKVLMGCQSNSKIHLVYVTLDGCKQEFAATFSEQAVAEDMFRRALLFFSSGYTCCLAKRHFPFPLPDSGGHLEGGVCFCQYVSQQLSREEWK